MQRSARWAGILTIFLAGCLSSSPLNPSASTAGSTADDARTAQWVSVGPVFAHGAAGKLNAFAFVVSNPAVMYVAGGWGNTPRESPSQAGIYRSTDGGAHWQPADNGLLNPDGTISSVVNGLWLDQTQPSILLAATEFGGTFRSTDGGSSWINVDRSESTQFAQVGESLYLASRRGVLVSADDGATWKISLPSTAGATSVVTAGGATLAGDAGGNVFRLSGDRWSIVGHPGTGAIHDIAIDPFDSNIVYANVDDARVWNQHLYGSIDGGKSWASVNCPCEVGAQAIAFSLVVPGRLYLGDDGSRSILYFTARGNRNPAMSRGAGTDENDVRYIFPERKPGSDRESCYFVSDQGLFYDASCTQGEPTGLSDGIPNFLAYDVSLPPGGTNMLVPLQDWSPVAGAVGSDPHFVRRSSEGGESFIDPYDSRRCYLAHPDNGLYRSSDGCKTFAKPTGRGIESLAFEPPDGTTMYAITHDDLRLRSARIAISADGGVSWHARFRQLRNPYQIVISPAGPKIMLVATGRPLEQNYVFVSRNGGAGWHESKGLPQALPLLEQYFPAHQYYAAFDPSAAQTVLLADHDPITNNVLIFKSIDGGLTFVHVSTLVQPPTPRPWPGTQQPSEGESLAPEVRYYAERFYGNRLAFGPPRDGREPPVVLTTRFGAFESADLGAHWRRIDRALIAHHFIGATWVDGSLYLASFGQGVVERTAQ
jgi:hypothetical protein